MISDSDMETSDMDVGAAQLVIHTKGSTTELGKVSNHRLGGMVRVIEVWSA